MSNQTAKKLFSDFEQLYDVTTEVMEWFARKQDLSKLEKAWVLNMIIIFRNRYDLWHQNETEFINTLVEAKLGRPFNLAALAHLHISFDLPFVINEARRQVVSKYGSELDPSREAFIFLRLGESIQEEVERSDKLPMGGRFQIARFFRSEGIIYHWMSNLRLGAWINAQVMRSSRLTGLGTEHAFRKDQVNALRDALEHRTPFWKGILGLRTPHSYMATIGEKSAWAITSAATVCASGITYALTDASVVPFLQQLILQTADLSSIPEFGTEDGLVGIVGAAFTKTSLNIYVKSSFTNNIETLERSRMQFSQHFDRALYFEPFSESEKLP